VALPRPVQEPVEVAGSAVVVGEVGVEVDLAGCGQGAGPICEEGEEVDGAVDVGSGVLGGTRGELAAVGFGTGASQDVPGRVGLNEACVVGAGSGQEIA
jgi:hypothetical protein